MGTATRIAIYNKMQRDKQDMEINITAEKNKTRGNIMAEERKLLDLDSFKADLKKLLETYDVTLTVDVDGDTHGLSYDFLVSMNKGPWDEYSLTNSSSIDSKDL